MKRTADSNWPVILILASVGSFSIALTPRGLHFIAAVRTSISHRSYSQPVPVRPVVLVATTDPDDANRVAQTVVPRRYQVMYATSPGAAQTMLRSNAGRIAVVVVNGKSPEGRSLAKLAQGVAPEAKVIRLHTNHGPTDLASELMAVI